MFIRTRNKWKNKNKKKVSTKRKNFDYLMSVDRKIGIIKNDKKSEADIKALLWRKLFDDGYDVRLEYASDIYINGQPIRNIFDIIIFSYLMPCVIEVKADGKKINKRQRKKYKQFDCELMFCLGESDVERCYKKIVKYLSSGNNYNQKKWGGRSPKAEASQDNEREQQWCNI